MTAAVAVTEPTAAGRAATTRRRAQLACAAGGLGAPPVALAALFGSGLMPPKPDHASAAQIAAFYRHHSDLRMAGILVAFLAIGLVGPLVTVISLMGVLAWRAG